MVNFTIRVVEATSSSLVTQTRKSLENVEFSRLFLYPVRRLFEGGYTVCYADYVTPCFLSQLINCHIINATQRYLIITLHRARRTIS